MVTRVFFCVVFPFMLALGTTSAAAIDFEDVQFPYRGMRIPQFSDQAESGQLTAKLVKPATTPSPYVVFIHGCGGLRLDAVTHWADFFVKHGVGVLMVDSFTARNRQEACSDAGSPWARRRADDAASAVTWLRSQPFANPDRIALFGQSQGGSAVLIAAQKQSPTNKEIVGTIAMYPACAVGVYAKLQYDKQLLVMIGDADTWTPPAPCQELKAMQLDASAMELTIFPSARHSFDNPGVYRLALGKFPVGEHAASRDKARERVAQFIEQRLR